MVDRARAYARIVTGGEVPDGALAAGSYYAPTLIADAGKTSEVIRDEVFGPVLCAMPFDTDDEAITLANDTPYGLAASAWTRDVYRALRATREIRSGCVWINDHIPIISEMPHGGMKESGFGKDMSSYSFEDYTVVKHVMYDITGVAAKPLAPDDLRRARRMISPWSDESAAEGDPSAWSTSRSSPCAIAAVVTTPVGARWIRLSTMNGSSPRLTRSALSRAMAGATSGVRRRGRAPSRWPRTRRAARPRRPARADRPGRASPGPRLARSDASCRRGRCPPSYGASPCAQSRLLAAASGMARVGRSRRGNDPVDEGVARSTSEMIDAADRDVAWSGPPLGERDQDPGGRRTASKRPTTAPVRPNPAITSVEDQLDDVAGRTIPGGPGQVARAAAP